MNGAAVLATVRTRARRLAGLTPGDARNRFPWRAIGLSLLSVALMMVLLETLAGDLNVIDTALLYLLLVFGIAVLFGSTPAAIAAIVAFFGLNLASIPPTGSLSIDRNQHLIALLVYLGIAIATGRLVANEAERSRQVERERERMQVLEQSDELKTALLAAVSHELRSPLATIKTSSSALLDPAVKWDEDSRRELLAAIDEEADRLDAVVGNLLDLSRIEGGALRPKKEWCDVEELVLDVADRLRKRSGDHPVAVEIEPGLALFFLDYVEIAQVLINLADNAIKYTPKGTPILIAARADRSGLVLTVHDEGPGIPAADLERVFDRFWRADKPGQSTGAGIGLTISRGFVEAHGGAINVESRAGAGTTFTVRLPKDGAV